MPLTTLALTLAVAAAAPAASELAALGERTRSAVVHLRVLEAGRTVGNGTGFFISTDGLIATNHHVVDDADELVAVLWDGREQPVLGVMAEDARNDIAIVKVEGAGYRALSLAPLAAVAAGDRIAVLGSPRGLSFTLSEGIVSAVRPQGLPAELIEESGEDARAVRSPLLQITAPIAPGSSGSPVLLRDGRVVGVAQSVFLGVGNLSFAVAADVVATLQRSIAADTRPRRLRRSIAANLALSAAVLAGAALVYLLIARLASGPATPAKPGGWSRPGP